MLQRYRILLGLVVVLLIRQSVAAADVPSASDDAKLTYAQRRKINSLVSRLRRARGDSGKLAGIFQEARAIGPPALQALHENYSLQMAPKLEAYRKLFVTLAAQMAVKQVERASEEEIAKLRQTVLLTAKKEGLTKEDILTNSEPALKRLVEIFLVDPQAVIGRSKTLQRKRQELLEAGMFWQNLAMALWLSTPESRTDPKSAPNFAAYLAGEDQLAAGLAVPMHPTAKAVLTANARTAKQLDPEEARAVLALNVMRNLFGLTPLQIDLKLCAAARDHSNDMRTKNFFAHESPVPGKATPWDRAKRFGTTASGENIFMGSQDGNRANMAWFHSPGHHKNMLGNHRRVGMGRSERYFTELFGQ